MGNNGPPGSGGEATVPERLTVLLIEDDPDFSALIQRRLEWCESGDLRIAVQTAATLQRGIEALSKVSFDVILLDLMLPDSRGVGTVETLLSWVRDVPVVVITNLDEEEAGLEAVARGAQDFILKEKIDGRLILRSLRYAVERNRFLRQIEAIIANAVDGMVVVDAGGIVRYVNPAAEKLLDRRRVELLDRPFGHPVRADGAQELVLPGPQGERVLELRAAEMEWRARPAYLVSLRDISHLRRIEQMKAEIRQRSQLEKVKDMFLSSLSHELRNPLSVVHAAVRELLDGQCGPLTGKQERMTKIADRNLTRLIRIMENLLDLYRIESGRSQFRFQAVDLREAVAEARQDAALLGRERKIDIELDLPEGLPPVRADPDSLHQVLSNLLTNALRYARGRVRVSARAEAEPPKGRRHGLERRMARLTVEDDGPGIPEQDLESLFDRYVQVARLKSKQGYKGTGLGLAICREIIRAHHGKIWAESPPGSGARFHVLLPAAVPEESAPAHPARAGRGSQR